MHALISILSNLEAFSPSCFRVFLQIMRLDPCKTFLGAPNTLKIWAYSGMTPYREISTEKSHKWSKNHQKKRWY